MYEDVVSVQAVVDGWRSWSIHADSSMLSWRVIQARQTARIHTGDTLDCLFALIFFSVMRTLVTSIYWTVTVFVCWQVPDSCLSHVRDSAGHLMSELLYFMSHRRTMCLQCHVCIGCIICIKCRLLRLMIPGIAQFISRVADTTSLCIHSWMAWGRACSGDWESEWVATQGTLYYIGVPISSTD